MFITLKAYLARLSAAEEIRLPTHRRNVPTLGELAAAVGIHQVTMTRIVGTKVEALNLQTAGRIITEMRRRGFQMEVNDLLTYAPPEDLIA